MKIMNEDALFYTMQIKTRYFDMISAWKGEKKMAKQVILQQTKMNSKMLQQVRKTSNFNVDILIIY